jgi:hypothetical protein
MAAGITMAVALGVTGCGEVQKLSAKEQVSDALSGFENAKSATFTVSIDSSVADIAAISKAQDDPMSASDQANLAKVLDGDVVMAVEAADGKTFGDAGADTSAITGSQDLSTLLGDPQKLSEMLKKQGAFSTSVRLSGNSLVDLRSVNGVIYAKADVKKILELAGEKPDTLDQQLSGLPPAMAPLAKAAKGEWVSLDLAKAAEAAKESGLLDALPKATPSPTVDAAKLNKLIESLKKAYQDKATITELKEDDQRGDGFRLSAPAKQVAEAVSPDLIALVGKTAEAEVRKAITEIPDKNFSLDVWVKDDKLTAVALDLTQFLDKPVPGKKLAVDVDIDVDSGKVEAPSGVTEIDVKELLKSFPGGALPGLGGAGGTSTGGGSATGGGAGDGTGGGLGGGSLTDEQMEQMKKQSGLSEKEIEKLMGQANT